ncbi:hypothetical protein CASFOL_033116 [Castilleja foliolosa]|uniref:Uncharacterized protein n=1 Tax=Castilleja foliolosa TaxID=1961234 RepID=A0ABD3C3D8_9LAMI
MAEKRIVVKLEDEDLVDPGLFSLPRVALPRLLIKDDGIVKMEDEGLVDPGLFDSALAKLKKEPAKEGGLEEEPAKESGEKE